jgi:hypothetical protein
MGHREDPPDPRDYKVDTLLVGATLEPPPSADLSRFVDRIRDQTITSSCVGQAFSRAVHVRAEVQGLGIPYPSALSIYTLARLEEGKDLLDVGCYPRNAATAMSKRGVCGESHWPFDEGRINDPVPWDVLQTSGDALVTGYYRVTGLGAERCALVRRALSSGYPVPYATQVDDQFEEYNGHGEIGAFQGPSHGGHMTCLIGYRPGAFLGVNSWGTGWGDDGFYWISDDRIGSSYCSDFYALTVAPAQEY